MDDVLNRKSTVSEPSADETAIRALVDKVRKAAWNGDFETYASCFVNAAYTTRWNASRITGTFVRRGWGEIGLRASKAMGRHKGKSREGPDTGTIENFSIRVAGNMAWATYDRRYAVQPSHRTGPDAAHHMRIFEKHDGEWKIAFFAFLDPGMGRPDLPLIRLDGDGTVLWMNPLAIEAMANEDDLVVRAGKLHIRDYRANQKLQAALRWATSLDTEVVPGRGALPIVLDAGQGLPAKVWWVIGENGAILFSLGEASQDSRRLDVAAIVYGLSPGQRRVAEYVAAGLGTAEIAEAMQIKPSTVRTHLDRIFEKTGVRNQPALVRALLSTSAPL